MGWWICLNLYDQSKSLIENLSPFFVVSGLAVNSDFLLEWICKEYNSALPRARNIHSQFLQKLQLILLLEEEIGLFLCLPSLPRNPHLIIPD